MYPTTYHRPKSLADALKLFSEAAEGRYISGGMTLLPTMKQCLAGPSDLIDLTHIAEMKGIRHEGEALTIGGAETHYDISQSETARQAIPVLAQLASTIGDPQVRYRGTIGGSIANNDPAADYAAAALALGATIRTDRRAIPADDFFTGLFSTALEEGEIVTAIAFPAPKRAGYEKFINPASRYAMAGVFVAERADGTIAVAVTGAGNDGVFRASEMEATLARSFTPEALAGIKIDPGGMISDIHGPAPYRANLVKVMAKRAVAAAAR